METRRARKCLAMPDDVMLVFVPVVVETGCSDGGVTLPDATDAIVIEVKDVRVRVLPGFDALCSELWRNSKDAVLARREYLIPVSLKTP